MGILDFIKRDKTGNADTGMDLPPVPKMDTEGLPPPPSDSSLPPLPTDIPKEVPPAPQETKMKPPKAEVPSPEPMAAPEKLEFPEIPEDHKAPVEPEQEIQDKIKEVQSGPIAPITEPTPEMPQPKAETSLPHLPEAHTDDIIPEKIPPLEGIPEPPAKLEKAPYVKPDFARPEPILVPEERPVLEQPASMVYPEDEVSGRRMVHGPLFIRTDRFRSAIDNIEQIKSKFKEEDNTFFAISEIKNSQDQKFESFRQGLEDIQRKLLFIDRALFERR